MSEPSSVVSHLPPEQQAIRAKCFHPSGTFIEFKKEEIEQSVPERFERIVRMYPNHIAVKTAKETVTYSELNAMANRLAHALLAERGNDAEPIALLFEKGIELLAAMLGVLKAGKFFVLLDPSYPPTRIRAVLEDCQAQLVITNEMNFSLARDILIGNCELVTFTLFNLAPSIENPTLPLSRETNICIMYTSGSTGAPKGVVWTHRNWLHKIMMPTNQFHICDRDRVTLLPSHSPNAITTIFIALLNGAALYPFDARTEGVKALGRWLSDEKISVCMIGSPLFRTLCDTLTQGQRFPELRLLRVGSEVVYKTDVDLFKRHFSPDCIFATGLGIAETAYIRIFYADHKSEIVGTEVPLGYAEEDKEILVLDEDGRTVRVNEVGEIAVKSSYLSSGYWRKPELTAVKFKSNADGDGRRLYLTGDLGLMLPDGCLIYKGRKDFRVKIRGHGIEIAEVERALLAHPAIREAVVVARKAASGEARLIAYFVSSVEPVPTINELRRFLKQKLPDYMLPSTFVLLDAMPLTTNGKIERQALPDPGKSRPALDTPFFAPRTPIEDEMAHLWAEILSLDQVGIHDNFFDLGGHSLLATQVIARMRDMFQVEIPLQNFFEAPTVADLAMFILRDWAAQEGQEQVQRHIANVKSD
jgi:amino acid adenylation domain-containing protein